MVDLSKVSLEIDDSMVDEEGNPRKDVLIFEGVARCHPNMKERLEAALVLFFGNTRVKSLPPDDNL